MSRWPSGLSDHFEDKVRHIAGYLLKERFDFLFRTTLSLSQCPELRDPSVNPASAPVTPRSIMCVVCPCVFTPGLCVRHLTPGHTHIPESLVFPHMDHNTLIYEQIRLSRSPLLPTLLFPCTNSHHLLFCFTLSNLSPPSSFLTLFFVPFVPLFSLSWHLCLLIISPLKFLIYFSFFAPLYFVLFLTLTGGSGGHEAMCRAKGLALSLIRNWGGALHGGLEPECPSWEDVSVTALSTYCQSDSESITSRDRGAVNTWDSQGQVNVTAPRATRAQGEKVRRPQEDSVCCTTSKYGSHTSPHTGNTGTLLFCCFLSHVKAYTCMHTRRTASMQTVLRNISVVESWERTVTLICVQRTYFYLFYQCTHKQKIIILTNTNLKSNWNPI